MADSIEALAEETHASTFSVRIDTEGHVLVGDEPLAQGGGAHGPSPFALMAAALAECTVMTMRWWAEREKIAGLHLAARVSVVRAGRGTEARDRLHKVVTVRGEGLTEQLHERLLAVASRCRVQRTLERGCEVTTEAAQS